MTGTFKANPTEVKLSEFDSVFTPPSDVHLLRTGVFSYYSEDDMEINSGHILSFIENFNKKVRGCDLAIDYSHDNMDEAAGWVEDLFSSPDGQELWAKIKWTPEGKRSLVEREYRYISAEFAFDYKSQEGNVSYGPTLYGAGLTNRPFVKNMKPLVEMSEQEKNMTLEELKAKVAEQDALLKTLNVNLSEKDALIKKQKDESEKVKQLAEKTETFNKMLSEAKVVEAQRSAFIEGDMVKFSELSGSVKFEKMGTSKQANQTDDSMTIEQTEEKIVELAKVRFNEGKNKDFPTCVLEVLGENKKLAEKYRNKELPLYTHRQ